MKEDGIAGLLLIGDIAPRRLAVWVRSVGLVDATMNIPAKNLGCAALGVLSFVLGSAFAAATHSSHRIETGAVSRESGFRMDGWFVWGGSAIEVEGTYHLFASRWPRSTGFPNGYMTHSEIVRATAENPLGPYVFQEVVLGKRDPKYWDAIMTHNPSIYKTGDTYVLYYNARGNAPYRQIGYATATNIEGPWTRRDEPIDFGNDANNPAALFEPDGGVKLMWRDRDLGIYLATAPSYEGPYTVVNNDVWPHCKLEDFYLFKKDGKYHMVCEDNVGGVSGHVRWGVHFISDDGIHDWQPSNPLVFYNHSINWMDGTGIHCERRERPQLLVNSAGEITHLFTSVLFRGATWNQPVPLSMVEGEPD